MDRLALLNSSLLTILNWSVRIQNINPFLTSFSETEIGLIIQLNQGASTSAIYKADNKIHKKALRLLILLEEEHGLFYFLTKNNIARILISEALLPNQTNHLNTIQFETQKVKPTIEQLARLKRTVPQNAYESALAAISI